MTDTHFQGNYEAELKIRLPSKSAFLSALKFHSHEIMLEDNVESDWYFDVPQNTLQTLNKSLCNRTMQPSGIQFWIVKGMDADRCEATNIADSTKASTMLETMGYEAVLKATTSRSIYFIGQYHIALDSVVGLGDFAEFAIMTDDKPSLTMYKRELAALAGKPGLTPSSLKIRSYRKMLSEQTTDR